MGPLAPAVLPSSGGVGRRLPCNTSSPFGPKEMDKSFFPPFFLFHFGSKPGSSPSLTQPSGLEGNGRHLV
jgi:hypothetical protein